MKQFIRDAEPEMRQDLATIIQTLKRMVVLGSDQQRILSLAVKWQKRDRPPSDPGGARTPLFDHFLILSKTTSYSSRSARNAWIEESASIYDGMFYTLTGGHQQEFQRVLAHSTGEATSGPAVERAENEWKGMGRQVGLGAYGIVQGMGLSLAGAFDSAAQTATGAAQSVVSMSGSHYQLAAPLAITPFISNSYDQLTPQVRRTLGANASNDVHIFGMTGDQFSKVGGQGVGQLMLSGFGKAAQATRYVQTLKKGTAVLHATQEVDASLHRLTDLVVARHEKDPNVAPATYLLDDDILSEMCVTLDAVADLGDASLGGSKTKKTATLRQVLRKIHLAARFGKDVVTAASTADTLIARAENLFQSRPNMSAMDVVTDPAILETLVAFVGSASDAAQVGSGASRRSQQLGKWAHRIKTSADFIAPAFQARQALMGMSDRALALYRHGPNRSNASPMMDAEVHSHALDFLSSAGMMASAGNSHSRPSLRLLAGRTADIVSLGRKGVALESGNRTGTTAISFRPGLDQFKNGASAFAHSLGDKARSAVQWMLPHFGGDGSTPPLTSSSLPEKNGGRPVMVADGGMTGPFYPASWKGRPYKSAQGALNDAANVAVYVNGVQTSLQRHTMAAQELAEQIGKPVIGIYNASGSKAEDFGQCATDKVGVLGMGKRNAAVNTLARVIGQHGSPVAKNGGLDLYAHSQGSIIVSEAIRQAKGEGHDVRGLDVTTFGNAAWSRPAGLRGYHNYAYDSDVIPTLGGSTSIIGSLLRTPFNRSNPLNPFMGAQGMTSTADDTFTLHHRGSGARPHGVIPDPLPDAAGNPVVDKQGRPVLDSEDYYIKALPRFRAKEAAVRARLKSLGPVGGPLAAEAMNSRMMTRSLGATAFAFAKSLGAGVAGLAGRGYGAASGITGRRYAGAAGLVQTGYAKTTALVQQGYGGAARSVAGAYSGGADSVASSYGRLDRLVQHLPSMPGMRPNTLWGALDHTFRGGAAGLDRRLRGGGAALDHGLRGAGRTTDARLSGSAAAHDLAARSGAGLLDRGLRRMGSGVSRAGRRGAAAIDDYYDATNALQRSGRGDHPDVDPTVLRSDLKRQSGGFLPDGNVRAKLGGHLGFDPGGARLHTGPAAASAARRLSAEAFTIGSDVFFGEGRFDPHTPKGLGLIAHELTHVGQQTGTTGDRARFFTERGGDEMEREAQQTGERVLANVGDRSGLFVEDYVREYEGEGGLTQADQRRLDHISLLALQGAQRLLPEGRVEAGKLGEMDIQVALDLSGMSDDEAASVWSEAIMAAVQGRRSDHGTRLQEGLKQQIQKWDSFEHFEIGNEAKGGPSAGIFLDCFDRDFPAAQRNAPPATWPAPWRGMSGDQRDALQNGLKYGDIVALSGDFYESSQVLDDPSKHGIPDPTTNFAALNIAPLREIMDLLPLIRRGSGTPPGQPVQHASTEELQAATGGRYLLLAKNNPVHFTNPPAGGGTFTGTNIQQWQGMHRQAIVAAMNGNANLAWGINAAADHFLTDAFSSGHARTPRTKLMTSDTANFQSAVLHNLDNDFGVDMANPRGDHWVAFGDDNYHDSKSPADTKNAANRKFVLEAAALSKEDIAAALTQGAVFSVPLRFASEQIVPHAVDLTHDRWTGRQDNPLLALAALTASSVTSLGLNLLLLTDYQREILHLAGSEGPGILTGAAGDTLIRDWVQRQSVPALSRQPGGEKIRMINRLMEGNISDEDVDAIEKLSGSVLTEEEMRVIRDDVTPQLPAVDRFKFGTAHRVRIRAAVNRIPVPPPVAPGLPPPVAPGLAEAPADTQEPGDAGTHLRSPRFRGDVVLEEVLHNKKVLRTGSSGRPIEKIQGALIDSGFALPRFGADSLFGRETGAAVAGFQTENDLAPVDGIVGPITMRSLDTLQSASPPPSRAPLRRPASGLSSPRSSPTAVPTVDVRATHIGGALSKLPVWHLFVVTTNTAGQQRFYRGGPGGAGQPPYGTIKTTFGPYVPGTVDWNPSAPSANVLSGPAAADKDSSLAAEMRRIDGSAVNYQPLGPNSNTVASTMLHKTGIAASKPVWLAPGWDQPDL